MQNPTPIHTRQALEEAVLQVCPGAQVQQRMSVGQGEGEFRQFTVPSVFGEDVMEFLIPGYVCMCGFFRLGM